MSEPVYLDSKELDEIADKLAGTDGSLDDAVADEYGIDDAEIDRIMDGRGYERSDGECWVKQDPAECGSPVSNK